MRNVLRSHRASAGDTMRRAPAARLAPLHSKCSSLRSFRFCCITSSGPTIVHVQKQHKTTGRSKEGTARAVHANRRHSVAHGIQAPTNDVRWERGLRRAVSTRGAFPRASADGQTIRPGMVPELLWWHGTKAWGERRKNVALA